MEDNLTWVLTDLPKGKRPIRCKWVYKIKYQSTDEIERYKTLLVAKGYNQIKGLDYKDSFSPVAKMVTIRIFIALVTMKQWSIYQLDINNTLLHDSLDAGVYMTPP